MLPDDWYLREDVEKLVEALPKLGFNCTIKDIAGKPTLVIWKKGSSILEQLFGE